MMSIPSENESSFVFVAIIESSLNETFQEHHQHHQRHHHASTTPATNERNPHSTSSSNTTDSANSTSSTRSNGGSPAIVAVQLPDPSSCYSATNEEGDDDNDQQIQQQEHHDLAPTRTYMWIPESKTLCELQCIPADHNIGSYFVGNYVIGDPNLYIITPMDPLFWVFWGTPPSTISSTTTTTAIKQKQQWQPMDQILSSSRYHPILLQCLKSNSQLVLLFDQMNLNLDGTSDNNNSSSSSSSSSTNGTTTTTATWSSNSFFKFSMIKAFKWLTLKQQQTQTALIQLQLDKMEETKVTASSSSSSSHDTPNSTSSFAPGFCVSNELLQQQPQPDPNQYLRRQQEQLERIQEKAKKESIQLVCNYLNEQWRTLFLDHVQVNMDTILLSPNTPSIRSSSSSSSSSTNQDLTNTAEGTKKSKLNNNTITTTNTSKSTMTSGAKKLAMTNIKGMKKMNTFFSTIKKSTTTTKKENEPNL